MSKFNWDDVPPLFKGKEKKLLKRPSFWDALVQTDQDYIMWRSESVYRGYFIQMMDSGLSGWVLTFDPKQSSKNRKATMCDLCKFVHGGGSPGTHFFSVHNRDRTRSVSFLACADLKCIDRCGETSVNSMRETLSKEQKIARLHASVFDKLDQLRAFSTQA